MKRKVGYEIKILNNLIERNIIEIHKNINECVITPAQLEIIIYLLNKKEAFQNELENYLNIMMETLNLIIGRFPKILHPKNLRNLVLKDYQKKASKNKQNSVNQKAKDNYKYAK